MVSACCVQGLADEAAAAYRRLLIHDKTDGAAHRGLGVALFRMGSALLRDAITSLQHAVDALPNDAVSHSFLSLAYCESGQLTLATQHARAAAELEPSNVFSRCVVMLHTGLLIEL